MTLAKISYKSYCWSIGTTSFRMKNFNKKIEQQLRLLNNFWKLYPNELWNENIQITYYNYILKNNFIVGNAPNKAKDAREKTCGLVDMGLITSNRRLTKVGQTLLDISDIGDFCTDNDFGIPKDSFIFFKQMLKFASEFDNNYIRPFIILIYAIDKLGNLTTDEFTYLLPLCINQHSTESILLKIKEIRNGHLSIDDAIIETVLSMDNYKKALKLLQDNSVTEKLICTIGLNRKSKNYDKPYFLLYETLKEMFLNNNDSIYQIYLITEKIKIGKYWRALLFSSSSEKAITKNQFKYLKTTKFSTVKTEREFKKIFFEYMHLFKIKATVEDYFDLNKRYIKNTDIILFEDNLIQLTTIPKYYFSTKIQSLMKIAYSKAENLQINCALIDIDKSLTFDESIIINAVNKEFGVPVRSVAEANNLIADNRYKHLNHLIDSKFTDNQILYLLDLLAKRKDKEVNNIVTDNADIPTIFEYILGILWYKISDRQGKLLDYMKLSLEADLLPKSHANGGEADIVYEYNPCEYYPKHSLLLEATLATSSNQRSMEMEPVSRHLGKHLIQTKNYDSYCIFATNSLNVNVISDFRSRKTITWYDTLNYENYIDGMKIIPLDIDLLKNIIKHKIKYKELYNIFDRAYNADVKPPHLWHDKCIKTKINKR